ncbi:MAG TPA: hypothetical protein VFQ26_06860 [Nitrospiraceae bacterium]|nr:hypothetical protein [Nitrospiraceae bacterium]
MNNPGLAAAQFFITSALPLSTGSAGSGRSLTGEERSGTGLSMWVAQTHRVRSILLCVGIVAMSALLYVPAHAIEVHPTAKQIQTALDQGKAAAQKRMPPDSFYVRFGVRDEVQPKGFLITKIGALSVMATHMALRGLQPSQADVAQVMEGATMLISTVIVGNTPNFAVDSYMVLDQGGKTIKPVTVRFDAQGTHSIVYPKSPRFKAKVVASFNYADFDPKAMTSITVYPATGGESSFSVNFDEID